MLGIAGQNPFLALFGTLVIIIAVGGMGHIVCEFCDSTRYQKYLEKGTKIGALGTIVAMGLMVLGNMADAIWKFIRLLFG